jgi:SHS family lactate transporter-like MFS transporter
MSGVADDQNVAPARTSASLVNESPLPPEMTAREYVLTRFSSLKPPMNSAPNPISLLMMLNGRQWTFFLVAFLAWVRCDPLVDFGGQFQLTSPVLGRL